MKSFFIFILGMITAFLIFVFVVNNYSGDAPLEIEEQIEEEDGIDGLTLFPEDKEEQFAFEKKQLNVLSCFPQKNVALVEPFPAEKEKMVMLLVGADNDLYYDNLKINIPNGKILKQTGIYQYETDDGKLKTVPVIKIKEVLSKENEKPMPVNKQNKK